MQITTRSRRLRAVAAALMATGIVTTPAWATDGYFSHGYGMRAKGMGGASYAVALDAFGGANNPAAMAYVGDRVDLGVDLFSPRRSAEREGSAPSLAGSADSDSRYFAIPEFGYNKMLRPDVSLGITVYGNGGMNTNYPGGQINCGRGPGTANLLCGNGALGVNLSQLIVAPTLGWKFSPDHAVGIAPLFAYQEFKAEGLQAFDNAPGFPPFTSSPGAVTNNGNDSSTGWGVRVGYQGRFGDRFRVGAVYTSKMAMSKFDEYKGLFAGQGAFDIPENYGAGVSFEAVPGLLLALDYERILYAGVPSIGNPSSNQAPLGADNGPGFGWRNVNVLRAGVQWQASDRWILRAGYNHSDNPVRSSDVTFNILAPGVVQDHVTAGFSYSLDPATELTMSYMHAFKKSVTGSSLFNAVLGPGAGGTETISMYQDSLGIAWSRRF